MRFGRIFLQIFLVVSCTIALGKFSVYQNLKHGKEKQKSNLKFPGSAAFGRVGHIFCF